MSAGSLRRSFRVGDEVHVVDVRLEGGRLVGRVTGPAGEQAVDAPVRRAGADEVAVAMGGRLVGAVVVRVGGALHVAVEGHVFVLEPVEGAGGGGPRHADEPHATSPMTGTVAKVAVAPGARATKGAELFVVEAMKMEYVVRAPRDVVVRDVARKAGDRVALGDVVVTFEEGA